MPVYLMSVFRMPCKVIEAIEAMMRNFFWGGREEHKRDHLVRWDIVSLPKKCGGLGVGNLKFKNMALLGKWLWRFPLESKSLWHSIILSKFGNHSNGWDVNTLFNATLRSPWKSIARIWEKYMENIKLVLGRGDRIRFWEDVWVKSSSLRDRFPRLYHLSLSQNAVISLVLKRQSSSDFSWDLNFSRNFNDRDIVDFTSLLGIIGNTHFNFNSGDKRGWVGTLQANSLVSLSWNVSPVHLLLCLFLDTILFGKGVFLIKLKSLRGLLLWVKLIHVTKS
ncbi:hypothetical protein LguiB_026379 [Lonicera macranthoides]